MYAGDDVRFALRAIIGYRLRTALILVAMAIGVASVIVLSALGDGARRYVTGEFKSLGTNLLIVLPGRSETTGGAPPLLGETPRDLTIDDALALQRARSIGQIAPIVIGSAPVSWQGAEREVTILGTTAAMRRIRHLKLSQGRFLPAGDPHKAQPVAVMGYKLKQELFANRSALGQWLRVGDRRYRVIGVLEQGGVSIGLDFDDMVLIPVASAHTLFDSPSLFRIFAEAKTADAMDHAADAIRSIIQQRHEGEDDVTIISQDNVIATFDRVLSGLTYGVAGIAAISLAVAGILIMNIMLVAVAQRTSEIGLLKALGASAHTVRRLFVVEAMLLSVLGAVVGVALGVGGTLLVARLYPSIPIAPPWWSVAAAFFVALTTGLVFGVAPAIRAAKLNPVVALSRR